MVTSICVIACALAVGQAPDRAEWLLAPQLQAGMELVYAGSYVEEALIPNVNYQRQYRLDTILFVLESGSRRWDVAFMTSLALRSPAKGAKGEDANPGSANPGSAKPGAKEQPGSVRLQLAVLDAQGQLQGNVPLAIPVNGPPTLECGVVVAAPLTKVVRNQLWEIQEEGRPPQTWQVLGTEACNGVTCIKLAGNQQSEDWDRPRADHTAWRRRDTVWLMPQLGVAQKVERIIERRDPARRDPTQRTTLRYELESRLKYPGRLLEDRRLEILRAKKFQDEARPLLAQPGQYRTQIESLQRKIAYYLDKQPPTPYRKAVVALQGRLDSARRGEIPPEVVPEEWAFKSAVAVGQRVPDFIVTDLTGKNSVRLGHLLGRPVLVFFYNPATATGQEVLHFALELNKKHGTQLGIMAMAVTQDVDFVRKQHTALRLPFAILDGNGMHQTFGVDATPRLVVLDGDGILRCAATGWGIQTPREIAAELLRCMSK